MSRFSPSLQLLRSYLQGASALVPLEESHLDVLDVPRGVERELDLAQTPARDGRGQAGPPRLTVSRDAVPSKGRLTPVFLATKVVGVGGSANGGDGAGLDESAPGGRIEAGEPGVAAVVERGADAGTLAAVSAVVT